MCLNLDPPRRWDAEYNINRFLSAEPKNYACELAARAPPFFQRFPPLPLPQYEEFSTFSVTPFNVLCLPSGWVAHSSLCITMTLAENNVLSEINQRPLFVIVSGKSDKRCISQYRETHFLWLKNTYPIFKYNCHPDSVFATKLTVEIWISRTPWT